MRRKLKRGGRVAAYAIGTILIVFGCTYVGLLLFDRNVDAPRQATLKEAVAQSQRNGENLCEFAVAISDWIEAVSSSPEFTPEQRDAVTHMQEVANGCQERVDSSGP